MKAKGPFVRERRYVGMRGVDCGIINELMNKKGGRKVCKDGEEVVCLERTV